MKPKTWIEPDQFFAKIADAGYGARKDDVKLTLSGALSKMADRWTLAVDDVAPGPQVFDLSKGTSRDPAESAKMDESWGQLKDLVGRQIEIEARWSPADPKKGAPRPVLNPITVRPAAPQ